MISHKSGSHRWVLKCHTKTHSCELICHTLRLALRFPLRFAFRFLGSCEVRHSNAARGLFTRRTLIRGLECPDLAVHMAADVAIQVASDVATEGSRQAWRVSQFPC